MTIPLIKTKFNHPQLKPSLVARVRLTKLLTDEFQQGDTFTRKLTLISAPAGYGKTTLTADWLITLKVPVVWFSLDENDNDPVRFLTYLINAVQQTLPEVGNAVLEMLQSPQLSAPEELLSPLLNEIETAQHPIILVLDDYHLIQTSLIHQYLNFLVEYLPPQMHIVIASREDPPLPLHRLRARGQMIEIRQDSIRFTRDEIASFFKNITGQTLSHDTILAVEHRTEGWIAGMQLLALTLQQQDADDFIRTFKESDRFVLDYLFEEVFHQQTEEIQEFLLKTSVLKNLSADLCDSVTGRQDSGEILKALEQSNLFTLSLDNTQTWYRYHRLFLDLLQHRLRLQTKISPQQLHKTASQWYQNNGYIEDAVNHALDGEYWEPAVGLISQASDGLMRRGAVATLIRWFEQIPSEVIKAKPEICLTYAWCLLLTGQVNEANLLLETAESMTTDHPTMRGEIASARAFQARTRGDEERMLEYSERALSLLPKTDISSRGILAMNLGIAYWHNGEMEKTEQVLSEAIAASQQTGNKYAEISSLLFLGRVHAVQGRLRQAAGIFNEIVKSGGRSPIVGLTLLDLSAINYELNDLETSERYLEQGIEWISPRGNIEFQIAGLMQKARLKLALGDKPGSLETLEKCKLLEAVQELPVRIKERLTACQVEIALAIGDLTMAERWAERVTIGIDSHPFYRFLNLTPIRLLMAQDRLPEALQQLKDASQAAEQAGWQYGLILLRVMQSLAAQNREAALEYLSEGVALAHPERFIRTFVDQGSVLIPLLKETARRGIFPAYIGEILAAYSSEASPITPPGIEPLSEREMEVLRLLAAGLTNRQIAEQLVVSISTIKSHVHHISSKLEAGNRTQAVARARQLGLL